MDIYALVRGLCPNAKEPYLTAFRDHPEVLDTFGVFTELRVTHFLGRCMGETGDFNVLVEATNYKAATLGRMWDEGDGRKAFSSRAEMMSFAGNGEGLLNLWYGNRMGNGPASTGDGYLYRGRGPLQTTGKDAYRTYGARMGVDLVANPDLLLDPKYILLPALYEWSDTGCNRYADMDDGLSIGRIINIGTAQTTRTPHGWADQQTAIRRVKAALDKATGSAPSGVAAIQSALVAKGFPVTVDGHYGPQTSAAIRAFQKASGITVDGIAGRMTLAKLGL